MTIGGAVKKGSKLNKTKRGVEREFTDVKALEREQHSMRRGSEEPGRQEQKPVEALPKETQALNLEMQEEEEQQMSRRERF